MRAIAGAWLAATMVAALGAQGATPPMRVVSEQSRTFVSLDALLADVATADVVFVNELSLLPNVHRVEAALLQALGGRDVILALDAIDRTAQEPLEHFQMEHLSDEEFLAQAKMPVGAKDTYLPLMKLAVARRWPIVATGGTRPDGGAAGAGPLIEAITLGSTGGKRPLLISLHAGASREEVQAIAKQVVAQFPDRRPVFVLLVAAPSLDGLTAPVVSSPGSSYAIYTLTGG